LIILLYVILSVYIYSIFINVPKIDNVIAAAILNQISDHITWRSFSHVNRVTFRVSKILLRQVNITGLTKIKHYIKHFDKFTEHINIHDITRMIHYELHGKLYGPVYIYDTNDQLNHIYSVKYKNSDNKTICRTYCPGTNLLEKETMYITDELIEYREWYKTEIKNDNTIKNNIKIKIGKIITGLIILRHGLYQKWSDRGILLAELNYNKGFRHGQCKTFRANGTMRYNYVYDNGVIISRSLWNKKGNRIN